MFTKESGSILTCSCNVECVISMLKDLSSLRSVNSILYSRSMWNAHMRVARVTHGVSWSAYGRCTTRAPCQSSVRRWVTCLSAACVRGRGCRKVSTATRKKTWADCGTGGQTLWPNDEITLTTSCRGLWTSQVHICTPQDTLAHLILAMWRDYLDNQLQRIMNKPGTLRTSGHTSTPHTGHVTRLPWQPAAEDYEQAR